MKKYAGYDGNSKNPGHKKDPNEYSVIVLKNRHRLAKGEILTVKESSARVYELTKNSAKAQIGFKILKAYAMIVDPEKNPEYFL